MENDTPHFATEGGINKELLENTVLALLKATPGLGSVQINKALILIDAFYHSYFKKTLTGITYIKHWYGPVPDYDAHAVLYKMEFNKIKVTHEKIGNVLKTAHYAICEPDYSLFPKRAIEIIRDVSLFIIQNKAGRLSEITHDTVYENTSMGGVIPIESVYSLQSEMLPWTNEEKKDAKKILEEAADSEDFDLSPFYALN
jgi:hypothetical protein